MIMMKSKTLSSKKAREIPYAESNNDVVDEVFKEFATKVANIVEIYIKQDERYCSNPFAELEKKERSKFPPKDWYIIKQWKYQETSGGSCWDTKVTTHVGDSEPDFIALDTVLEIIWPNISYLDYKKLLRTLKIEQYDYNVGDYYGNSTDYRLHALPLIDLYNAVSKIIKEKKHEFNI